MARLDETARTKLPDRAFAYVDSKGNRRLPINDEAHVRAALSRFNQVRFEDDAARDRARTRLMAAAKRYGIVPVGFVDQQVRILQAEAGAAAAERTARLPSGAVTLLMTDIEGSTGLLQSLGDHYPPVLSEVRRLHRVAVQRAGGIEVDARADEFFAAFEAPLAALDAAVTIQRRLARRTWPGDHAVRVRIGLHHGRPTLTAEGYVGVAVHTVARITAAGHGGQILISRVARDAYELAHAEVARPRTRHARLEFEPLGRYQLAGLHRPESLFGVVGAGLLHDLPVLRVPRVSDNI